MQTLVEFVGNADGCWKAWAEGLALPLAALLLAALESAIRGRNRCQCDANGTSKDRQAPQRPN